MEGILSWGGPPTRRCECPRLRDSHGLPAVDVFPQELLRQLRELHRGLLVELGHLQVELRVCNTGRPVRVRSLRAPPPGSVHLGDMGPGSQFLIRGGRGLQAGKNKWQTQASKTMEE